jgi:RNA polymerase sigma-70 factor (ECF subfamily)
METQETDMELISRYRRGDDKAMEFLVEKYRRQLFGFILNMTRGAGEADDIFQEVWFKALKKIGTYTENNFPGWLIRIAHNIVIDRIRAQKPNLSMDMENEDGQSLGQTIAAPVQSPSRRLEAQEIRKKITQAVESLPPEQKEVFLMRVETDLPFKEISAIQGISINTALARMQYALAKLKAMLQEDYAAMGGAR